MITPEQVPAILLEMVLNGEAPEQLETLQWTLEECPEFLEWASYPNPGTNYVLWPNFNLVPQPELFEKFTAWRNLFESRQK